MPNPSQKLSLFTRKALYGTVGLVGSYMLPAPDVTIFCYHGLADDEWRFNVSPDEFKRQVRYLLTKYHFVSLDEVSTYINQKKAIARPAAVLTFDDGYANLAGFVPYFKELGIRPTVFVLAQPDRANRLELDNHHPLLSTAQIKELDKAGWIIGCHSATHTDFSLLSPRQLHEEISQAKVTIEKMLHKPVKYFAYPKGAYTPAVLAEVKAAGFELALSMDAGVVTKKTKPFVVPRVGIDRSHNFLEFKATSSVSSIMLRQALGKTALAKRIV